MKKYNGYLIDLDGTVYNGSEKIEAAIKFMRDLKNRGVPYLFLTNNSTKHPRDVAKKLREMSIDATEEQVLTTSMATADYIYNESKHASVYAIGEEGLHMALLNRGFTLTTENPEYVVMGLDRDITYDKLATGTLLINNGSKFIATNGDIKLPSERGFLPGSGSLISVLSVSTETTPVFIGKPEPIMVDLALKILGTTKEETLMVGDNYYTDILAGINGGIDTLLVYSGVTTKEEMKYIDKKPTYALDTLADWVL